MAFSEINLDGILTVVRDVLLILGTGSATLWVASRKRVEDDHAREHRTGTINDCIDAVIMLTDKKAAESLASGTKMTSKDKKAYAVDKARSMAFLKGVELPSSDEMLEDLIEIRHSLMQTEKK